MDEGQRQFTADAQEIVEKLDRDLDQLRVVRFQGPRRRELAARIFRRVHTLKGSAASLGLETVREVSHEFESVLDSVRLGRLTIDDSLLNLFEETTNVIAQALSREPTSGEVNAKALIARLQAIASTGASQGRIASTLRATLPPDVARSLSEYDLQHAREAVREGARLFIISAGFAIEDFDQNFRELSKLLGQIGEVIATVPGEFAAADEISFRLLYAAEVISEEIARRAVKLGRIEIRKLKIEPALTRQREPAPADPLRMTSEEPAASVRVELSELDRIITDAGELFRDTTNVLSAARAPDNQGVVTAATLRLRRRFVELEERLIKLRLVPLAETLERVATRAGRIAARQLGKEVEFEIVVGDIAIDKPLADAIAEPLLHLVRNAVSHGLESPEERTAAGKNVIGKLKLAAFSESGRIQIAVNDDGRGIDFARVAAAAREQGIAGHDSLTMDQCLRLIFRPGFSTAAEVSDLSGRGIGLDVVDRAMEQAGGEVRVHTEAGKGTTFLISLPVALALVRCMIVRSGDQLYAIASARVAGEDSLDGAERGDNGSAGVIDWKGEKLPLFSLARLLDRSADVGASNELAAVILETKPYRNGGNSSEMKMAIAVERIEGKQETLVRSLGRYGARWPGVSGAAELADGSVALLLDVEELIEAPK
jgi:two-component system chemotaxis sensor kinase CheA